MTSDAVMSNCLLQLKEVTRNSNHERYPVAPRHHQASDSEPATLLDKLLSETIIFHPEDGSDAQSVQF